MKHEGYKKKVIVCISIMFCIVTFSLIYLKYINNIECPSIELGVYINLPIEQREILVSETEVQSELEHRLMKYAKYEKVKKRGIENGDIVTIIFNNMIDNSEVENDIRIGDKEISAEFDKVILGMTRNETKEVKIESINYKVKIKEIEQVIFPKLSNQFVKEYLGYDSLVKYKKQLEREIFQIKKELEKEEAKSKLISLVVENSQIHDDLNEKIEKQFQELKKSYETYARVNKLSYEDVLRQYDTSEKKMWEHVEENIKQDIVTDAIIRKEHINFDEAQFHKLEMDYVTEYGYNTIEEFIMDCGKEYLEKEVKREYIKDFLYDNAEIS